LGGKKSFVTLRSMNNKSKEINPNDHSNFL